MSNYYTNKLAANSITMAQLQHEITLAKDNGIDIGKEKNNIEYIKLSRKGSLFALNRKQRYVILEVAQRIARCESERKEAQENRAELGENNCI